MAAEEATESYLELYDLAKKETLAKTPLAEVRFIPRTGERIFIASKASRDWDSYTVVSVEYFLGYEASTGKPAHTMSTGIGRITLYVEESK